MDQGPLEHERIGAGVKLVNEFDRIAPLQAAFGLKANEDGEWFLYLVSDQINDNHFDLAHGDVIRLLGRGPKAWLHWFRSR